MYIVTHTNPDFDAICGVWLLRRFGGLGRAKIEYVNTGNPDAELLAEATAVVDTGKEFNPERLRFDHHHLPGREANDTCAAMQVYDHLLTGDESLSYLRPLINLIFWGDTGREAANFSRELGLHALLSGWRIWVREQDDGKFVPDNVALSWGAGLLDALEARLREQAKVKAELAEKVVYKSDDGLVWAIRFGSTGTSFAAYEQGARIVLFEGEPIELDAGTTYPVGCMRAGEWQEPHVGDLIDLATRDAWHYHDVDINNIAAETSTWFKHPAGFFAGRGTAKAPVFEPVNIKLEKLAQLVDWAWEREPVKA